MKNYRYTLEPYKGPASRYTCPACGVKHQLVRYIDTETNQHLADHIGRCNREYQCGYHAKPKEYLEEVNRYNTPKPQNTIPLVRKPTPPDYIPEHALEETLCNYDDNHFVSFLKQKYGTAITQDLINRYKIGTNHYWDSSTVFWQIDIQGRIRTGKVMLYNPATGKRLKEHGQSFITWMHKVMRYDDFTLQQCLFGEHLLKGNTLPVAIAESEKTAIIASCHIPGFVWLATGSLQGLTAEKLKVCRGRRIILFPDADAMQQWTAIAATVPNCRVSPLVENWRMNNSDTDGSCDLADILLRMTG